MSASYKKYKSGRRLFCLSRFTILELLIVIAIIVILASLLLPSLARVKGKAKQIDCAGRLKQWGTALNMYASDYNEIFPLIIDQRPATPLYWYQLMQNYMPTVLDGRQAGYVRTKGALIRCPSNPTPEKQHNYPDYTPNSVVFPRSVKADGTITGTGGLRLSMLKNISKTLLLLDGDYDLAMEISSLNRTNPSYSGGCWVDYRHGGGANILFGDSHVSWMRGQPGANLDIILSDY